MKNTPHGLFTAGILTALLFTGCSSMPAPPTDIPWEKPPTFEDGFCTPLTFTSPKDSGWNKIPFMAGVGGYDFVKRPGPFVWDAPDTIDTVSHDGRWLLSGQSSAVVDLDEKKKGKKEKKDEHEKTQAFSDRVTVWSLTDGSAKPVIHSFTGDTSQRLAWLAFTPDSSAFVVCRKTLTTSLTLHDRSTGNVLQKFAIREPVTAGVISPGGDLVAVAAQSAIEFWNLRNGKRTAMILIGRNPGISELRYSPDGKFLFAVTPGRHVKVYDLIFYNEIVSFPIGIPCCIDVSPDGRLLMVAVAGESKSLEVTKEEGFETKKQWESFGFGARFRFYEIGTWQLLWETEPRNRADYAFRSIRFSRDGQSLLAAGNRFDPEHDSVVAKTALCRYDLRQYGGDWIEENYRTLPLHPEGKFLLGGRPDSVSVLSPWDAPAPVMLEMK